jgi:hypothetical protein
MKWIETEGMKREERAVVRAAITALLYNDGAMSRLYATAQRYLHDAMAARELVWDVAGDLLLGDLTCDVARDLGSQLGREVRRRAKRARRDARRAVTVALEEAPADMLIIEAEPERAGQEADKSREAAEMVTRIRALACDDDAVLQLLGYYERDLVTRREVLGAGMTQWVYRAARERLVTYAGKAAAAMRTAESATAVSEKVTAGGR